MSCHFPLHFRLSNYVRQLDWCLAAGKLRGTLGRVNNLFNMAAQSISSELSKCVRDLILLVEQGNFCEDDVAQFRLDWLYSAVVRYVDHIPSGEAVMNRLHQVAVLLATNKDDCRNSSVYATNGAVPYQFMIPIYVPKGKRARNLIPPSAYSS